MRPPIWRRMAANRCRSGQQIAVPRHHLAVRPVRARTHGFERNLQVYDVYIIGARDAEPGLALMLGRDGLTIVAVGGLGVDGATAAGDTKSGKGPIRVAAPANDSLASVPVAGPRVMGPHAPMIACREGVPDRRLVAIFAADAANYSRLMRRDEVETFRVLTSHREVMDTLIVQHRGGSPARPATASSPSFQARWMRCDARLPFRSALRRRTARCPTTAACNFASASMSAT